MKRIFVLFAAALLLCSCAPQAYTMLLELRQPCKAGLFLDDKSMAVVYVDDGDYRDSLFCNCFADGLARGLEADYFEGKPVIEIYDATIEDGVDYSCKDSLQSLILKLDKDVVFLVTPPVYEAGVDNKLKCNASVFTYDSMYPRDVVIRTDMNSLVSDKLSADSEFASDASFMGLHMSKSFTCSWSTEAFSLIYMDGSVNPDWTEAIYMAENMDWSGARDLWMGLSQKCKGVQQACASYDAALACFMLGEYGLALEWLDLADGIQMLSLSPGLRERIKKAVQQQ